VLDSVAAILRPTWPDLPIPIITTLPLQADSNAQALLKESSSLFRKS